MCHFLVKVIYLVLAFVTYIKYSQNMYYAHETAIIRCFCCATYGGIMINGFGLLISFVFRQRSYEMEIVWALVGAILYPISTGLLLFHFLTTEPVIRELEHPKTDISCIIISLICSSLLTVDGVYTFSERKWAKQDTAWEIRTSIAALP